MGLDSSPSRLPLFFNKLGVSSIEIGVTACHCMGALPPHDHPHVYLNISEQNDILCPYCSTEFRLNRHRPSRIMQLVRDRLSLAQGRDQAAES
jgi:uncharacterized Zn-finger protein